VAVSLVAATVLLLALDGGAFSLPTRTALGIAVWWAIFLAALLGLVPARPLPWTALATGGLLAGFAVWTGLSMTWAPSPEKAFLELDRVLLYLGIFLLAAVLGAGGRARLVSRGLALGVVAVGVVALVSRFAPHLVSPGPLADTIPSATSRLSFPVDYWNGLAMLVGLAVPLLLATAVMTGSVVVRSLAVAPLPAIAAVSYLASSRGGFIVTVMGLLLFVALTDRRWSAVIASAVGTAGSVAAILMLADRPAIVETPLAPAGRAEAGTAAFFLIAICALTGLAYGLLRAIPVRRPPPAALGWGAVVLAVTLAAAGAVSARPVERFEEFRRVRESYPTTVEGHLLNVSSTGRWQQWEAAVDQFRSEPLHGGGAGSWGAFWLQHGQIRSFVSEAHSLYLEVLGELGAVGLVLLGGALGLGLATGIARALQTTGGPPTAAAGVAAALGAFLTGAAIDWMWELTIVSVVGFVCLGLATGYSDARPGGRLSTRNRSILAAVALVVVALQAIPLLANAQLRKSERAVSRGDIASAVRAADAASRIQPWAASPHLQLALVAETAGRVPRAQRHLSEALTHDSADWRLWLVATRLHVKRGDIAAAEEALARARRLNPRSALLVPAD